MAGEILNLPPEAGPDLKDQVIDVPVADCKDAVTFLGRNASLKKKKKTIRTFTFAWSMPLFRRSIS